MRLLFLFILCLFSFTLHAQIDSEQKSLTIPVIESEEGDIQEEVKEEGKPIKNQGFIIPKEDNINGLSVPQQKQPTDLPKEGIVVLGNEANGISKSIEFIVKRQLTIPQFGDNTKTESLNVANATAIILSEFRRRFIEM